tara:strand:+ start:599 stop:709 length:111 start_codon:yes stop_codon:yes gene_type:complete
MLKLSVVAEEVVVLMVLAVVRLVALLEVVLAVLLPS